MRFAICLVLLLATQCPAETLWPQFRGPSGQGVSSAKGLPLEWSEDNHIAWKTAIPGRGWSSPVVHENQIWMTTAIESLPTDEEKKVLLEGKESDRQVATAISLRAICVDRTSGDLLHDVELFRVEKPDAIHSLNSYASPTPVIEPGRLYCHFGTYGTACIDTASLQIVWQRQLSLSHSVGPGSSPIVWKDLLLLVCDGMDAQYVTGLDKSTGDTVWKTNRPPLDGEDGEMHKAFSTPLVIPTPTGDQLIAPGAQWFVSYDAESGVPLWKVNHGKGFSNVAMPVSDGDTVYLITGFMKPVLWALPTGNSGDLSQGDASWTQDKQIPTQPSPVLVNDLLFIVGDRGVLSCIDRKSGEIHWTQRIGGNFSASPMLADGHVYLCSQEGLTTVFRPDAARYVEVAENRLSGQLMASPLAIEHAIYLRSDEFLYRIEQ